jgi:enoyl-CoA hydratase
MELQYLKLTSDQAVATVTIHRPDKGNSLSPEVLREIGDLFLDLSGRKDISVVILTGGEKIFSAGFDLDAVKNIRKDSNEDFVALFHRAYRSIRFCAQPVLAAIGGPAMAGGFDLTQMCDIRYASEKARFGQREVVLSLIPMLDPLFRIIGFGPALEWALTGKDIDVEEAYRLGFVTRIFPQGTVIEEVTAIARKMAANDRTTLVETKRLSIDILHNSLDSSMKSHEWLFRSYVGSDDNRKRIDIILESIRNRSKT